jgi:hypothetical protein
VTRTVLASLFTRTISHVKIVKIVQIVKRKAAIKCPSLCTNLATGLTPETLTVLDRLLDITMITTALLVYTKHLLVLQQTSTVLRAVSLHFDMMPLNPSHRVNLILGDLHLQHVSRTTHRIMVIASGTTTISIVNNISAMAANEVHTATVEGADLEWLRTASF